MKDVNYNIAYEYIRKRILSGTYAPGQPLLAKVLAEEIGLSRTSVREALRQLEVDGLVSIQPHLGAKVKAMGLPELSELCELRLALESHAAGLAARNRTTSDLQEIKFALEEMRLLTDNIIAAETKQPLLIQDLMQQDVRFHIAIISASKNILIKKEILRFHLINRIVTNPLSTVPDVEESREKKQEKDVRRRAWMVSHEAIFLAIDQHDSEAAKREMERHIQGIIDNSLRQMARTASGLVNRQLSEDESSYVNH
jgi:DNA-binding GntR family transcriptional regulator